MNSYILKQRHGLNHPEKGWDAGPIRWHWFHMTHWFNGGLDDVRLYDRALSDAEVAKLYKSAGGKAPTKRVRELPK